MGSLYKKELQSFFLSPLAYIVSAVFMLIFSLTFMLGISNLSGTNVYKFSFPNIFYNNFFYFLFLIPILTMRAFPDERKYGTSTLLLSSPVSLTKIVLSKFFAIATVFLLMMVLSLFYPIVAMTKGDVVWSALISGYIGFFLWGLVCISIGLFISSFFESVILSAIFSEAAMLVLIEIDNVATSAFFSNVPVLSDILMFFSTQQRFVVFSQGLFRLTDIIFYITGIIVFLIWTVIVLERRRWTRG